MTVEQAERLAREIGCGKRIHVAGTNGGTMPCGGTLRDLHGDVTVELCADCQAVRAKQDAAACRIKQVLSPET